MGTNRVVRQKGLRKKRFASQDLGVAEALRRESVHDLEIPLCPGIRSGAREEDWKA